MSVIISTKTKHHEGNKMAIIDQSGQAKGKKRETCKSNKYITMETAIVNQS